MIKFLVSRLARVSRDIKVLMCNDAHWVFCWKRNKNQLMDRHADRPKVT